MTLTEFIEYNIDIIDDQNWYDLYDILYNDALDYYFDFNTDDFFEAMNSIQEGFKEFTLSDRQKVMNYYLEKAADNALQSVTNKQLRGDYSFNGYLPYSAIISQIVHHLGFTLSEIQDLISNHEYIPGTRVTRNGRKALDVRDII